MVSLQRWRAAQRYERTYWEASAGQIAAGTLPQLDWYEWRTSQLVTYLKEAGFERLASGHAHVIEIGSGPVGIVGRFPAAVRVAVDPLEPVYSKNPVLTELRSPDVSYLEGMGEDLPCAASSFDLAIVDNCIDHVHDVAAAMREVSRVLRPGGLLYLAVNCRTPLGFMMHRLLSRLRIDEGHPHTFTPRRAHALLRHGPFRLLWSQTESAAEARRADRASPQVKARLKALLGTSEFCTRILAQRETPRAA